jgi:hypothetical protein
MITSIESYSEWRKGKLGCNSLSDETKAELIATGVMALGLTGLGIGKYLLDKRKKKKYDEELTRLENELKSKLDPTLRKYSKYIAGAEWRELSGRPNGIIVRATVFNDSGYESTQFVCDKDTKLPLDKNIKFQFEFPMKSDIIREIDTCKIILWVEANDKMNDLLQDILKIAIHDNF